MTMKLILKKYLPFAILGLAFTSCEPEFDTSIEDNPITSSKGTADFSKYVAVGNSLTAGFADGALYIDGQQNSLSALLANQMKAAGGGEFTIPLMNDNIGGFADIPNFGPRRVFDVASGLPVLLEGTPTTNALDVQTGPFNNMGVPGAKSFHLFAPGYGNPANLSSGTANPYFVRMASRPDATLLEDALSQEPTFFSYWLGNNDILGFATSGGDSSEEITAVELFTQTVQGGLAQLSADGTRPGIVANIPDIKTVPFFTTVPNNALVLDAEQAANLTGFFRAYAGIVTQGVVLTATMGNPSLATPALLQQANAIGSQYAFTFNPGPNRFIIKVEETLTNPRGIRQMTAEELLVLTINQNALRTEGYGSVAITPDVLGVLGKLQAGGTPTQEEAQSVLNAVNPIADNDALDTGELLAITEATNTFNAIITQTAEAFNLAVVDVKSVLEELQSGIDLGNGNIVSSALGLNSAFSLDGVHLNPRGNAELANRFIKAINETYGSTLKTLDAGNFQTVKAQ